MTSTPQRPLPSHRPTGRRRRVKRGIVAGYIHDISPRHRVAMTPVTPVTPVAMTVPAVTAAPSAP